MNLLRIVANDARDAIGQIRSRLGAEAVVLSVTQVPVTGFDRWWRKPRLEVLAGLPEPPPELTPYHEKAGDESGSRIGASEAVLAWRTGPVLRQMGLEPAIVETVLARARQAHGEVPSAILADELAQVREALTSFWRPVPRTATTGPPLHVFVGPPAVGKTTALCKWLAKFVLGEGGKARAWRLDGGSAHFGGLLDIYGEILGIRVEREWKGSISGEDFDAGFLDLPGINPQDATALGQLKERVQAIANAQVHLVLNAAYETSVLLAQARAFAAVPIHDLILTHLDEEKRPGKLWNLIVGTNFSLRFLSGGQNIPGLFALAGPEALIPWQNRPIRPVDRLANTLLRNEREIRSA